VTSSLFYNTQGMSPAAPGGGAAAVRVTDRHSEEQGTLSHDSQTTSSLNWTTVTAACSGPSHSDLQPGWKSWAAGDYCRTARLGQIGPMALEHGDCDSASVSSLCHCLGWIAGTHPNRLGEAQSEPPGQHGPTQWAQSEPPLGPSTIQSNQSTI
jgi:hypothetical protein